jgi:hypothetical protein
MNRITIAVGAILLLLGAATVSAQDGEAVAPVAEPAAEEAPAVETDPAAETAPAAETQVAHDWEFVLSATDKAPGASATVMVVEAESGSDFVLVANGLPEIDALDEENRDVNAYTVWVVPGKDKVAESKMAGVLTVADGSGRLEASTELETFGLIVTATPDGAPEKIGGVPVLTGIPVQATAPPEAVEAAADAAEDVVDEMAEDDADVAADVEEEVAEGVSDVEEETTEAAPEAQP